LQIVTSDLKVRLVSRRAQIRYCVLLVDDDKRILNFMGLKLKASGYEVITATTGQEALRLVEFQKPDIMVLDILMPGMSGLEVLEELRTVPKLPTIVISARIENVGKALELGASSFMCKPFNPDDLMKRIQAILADEK
jgi:DNA-binding response OmpR family regulator